LTQRTDCQTAFMGYNTVSNALLPNGKVDIFHAFFTHKSALDNDLLDLLRPLLCYGVRTESFARVLIEWHSKRYFKEFLADEYKYGVEKAKDRNFKDDIFVFQ
jgi:hypothetical protein